MSGIQDHNDPRSEAKGAISNEINEENSKNRASSHFFVKCLCSSAGIVNIWRFPYLAYENSGVSFVSAYIILLLVVGSPLFFMEAAIGQYSGRGPAVLGNLVPLGKGLTVAMNYITFIIMAYYGAIMTHCMAYIIASFNKELPWISCQRTWNAGPLCINKTYMDLTNTDGRELSIPAENFYENHVLKLDQGVLYNGLGPINGNLLMFLAISWILIYIGILLSYKNPYLSYATPLMAFLMIIALASVSLPLKGSLLGLKFLFHPTHLSLYNMQTWRRAAEQVFYSLDISTGNIIMHGSICHFRHRAMIREIALATICNLLVSLASGSIAYSVIGALATETNIEFHLVLNSGQGLAFVTFSEAVLRAPFPKFWSVFIFVTIFIICLQTIEYNWVTCACLSCLLFLSGIPCITGGGQYIITLLDDIGAAFGLVLIGLFEAICVFGIYGIHRFSQDIHFMLGHKVSFIWPTLWITSPIILGVICLLSTMEWHDPTYTNIRFPTWALSVSWVLCLTAVFIIVVGAIIQAFSYYSHGVLSNVIKPTSEWSPANKMLRWARDIFPAFGAAFIYRYMFMKKAMEEEKKDQKGWISFLAMSSQKENLPKKRAMDLYTEAPSNTDTYPSQQYRFRRPRRYTDFRTAEVRYAVSCNEDISSEYSNSNPQFPDSDSELMVQRIFPTDAPATYISLSKETNVALQ